MSKSIIQKDRDKCFVCGDIQGLEEHHIFQGCNRKNSEKYGLKMMLCHRCHNEPPEGAHYNDYLRRELHAVGQIAFEKKYGHEKFMQVFGMDYIEKSINEGRLVRVNNRVKGKYGLLL